MFNSLQDSPEPQNSNNNRITSAPVQGRHLLQQTSGKDGAAAGAASNSGSIKVRERKFENGDRYRGGWLSGLPEGEGKYEWADGSCYEGGWKAGHKHGSGKYTWNSGASYQGEWQNGYMHGVGTFEAPDGSKYQGGWREDLKHGLGRKIYANGDVYEGLWCNGKPDGPGRYIWVDFNEYDGEWRTGRLHGQGTFVWKTGERYDGEWKGGQEDGVGMFTFRDGSTYEGFWHKGKKHGVGIFRPANSSSSTGMDALRLRFDSTVSRNAGGSSTSLPPSSGRSAFADATAAAAAMPDEAAADYMPPKRPSKPVAEPGVGEGQQLPHPSAQPGSAKSYGSVSQADRGLPAAQMSRPRRDQVMLKEYNEGRLMRQQVLSPADIAAISSALGSTMDSSSSVVAAGGGMDAAAHRGSGSQQVTPLGEVLYKEHSAYDLMVQLQLGIRWSVTSAALDYTSPAASLTGLQPPDYATTITQEFPRAGSRSTPVHPAADFVWKDYAPAAFRVLRELAGVEQHEFINQLCGDQALRLLTTQSKSGAMFFLSADERFLVRTITCAEKKLLLSLLQRYVEHINKQPNSLLTRFYGLHRVSATKGGVGKKVRFLVMGNIFYTQAHLRIHRRYDLKGCTKGRTVGPAAVKNPGPGVVLKDLDLRQRFKLDQGLPRKLYDQLDADTRLLASTGVMGYSMLLGVHEGAGGPGSAAASEQLVAGQPVNFAEHSNATDLAASMGRLEVQLSRLQLDKWAHSALLQLGRANLLVGLASAGSKAGGSGRRGLMTRSPTLVLATRPKRSNSSRRQMASIKGPGATGAAVPATAAPRGAAAAAAAAAGGAPAAAAAGEDISSSNGSKTQLRQHLGAGIAARAIPLSGGTRSTSGTSEAGFMPDVVLYFGVIDFLQAYSLKKRLASLMRRMVSSAQSISTVSPGFYAARFRRAMRKVFI